MPARPRKKPGRTRYLVIDPELDRQFEELFVTKYGQSYTEAIEQAMRRHLDNPPPRPTVPAMPMLPPVAPPAGQAKLPAKGKPKR